MLRDRSAGFRKTAKTYEGLTEMQVQYLLDTRQFT